MQCHESRHAISKMLDGLLDYEEEFAVRQHINGCPECRVVLNAFEQDEQALTGYVRQAPYAPVAREVIEEIERRRSPWWDAFMAGSYRLASVAGLVLVLLVVGAGAWMLREVATSDPPADDQPVQETTLGAADQGDEVEQLAQSGPPMIGLDEVDLIVDRLDESGLVFDTDAVSQGNGYAVEYGRIAFDRHLTLLEYHVTELDDDARLMIGAFGANGGGGADFSDGRHAHEGWLALPAIDPETETVDVQDGQTLGDVAQNVHSIAVDLSPIAAIMDEPQTYDVTDRANGIELCCLTVEHGVAVSRMSYDWEIVDGDSVAYVDESLQSVDSPPEIELTAEPIWPEVTVDGEQFPMLEQEVAQALMLDGDGLGLVDLPETGSLNVHFDHVMLPDENGRVSLAIYEGPWSFTAQLGAPTSDPEPTPEPTEPPMVAAEETPEPEGSPAPEQDADTPDSLRVLVYLVRDDEIGASSRQINYTQDVATASIESLLNGPLYEDEDAGLHSEIPEGTELLDIALNDGTLMVDLSSEFSQSDGADALQMRMAQIVHTATQFDTVERVDLLVDGQTIAPRGGGGESDADDLYYTRDDFEEEAPAILIETPAPHDVIGNEIRLTGTANTFEANLQIEVLDPHGEQVYRDHAMASSGTGTRGEFDLTILVEFEGEGMGAVRMFEHSARDGSRTNVVTIPVQFQ